MNSITTTSHRFKEVIFDGQLVANTNYSKTLETIDFRMAHNQFHSLNTIYLLTRHIHYYIKGVHQALLTGELTIRDANSFNFEPLEDEHQWIKVKELLFYDAQKFYDFIKDLPASEFSKTFIKKEYGTIENNLNLMIEHCYYHLGQIVLIKKLISTPL